jgi:hypothetical protein
MNTEGKPLKENQKQPNKSLRTQIDLYGEVFQMGGKTKPNIHLDADGYSSPIIIKVAEEFFINEDNKSLLKTRCHVLIDAYEDVHSGEIDKNRPINLIRIRKHSGQIILSDDVLRQGTERLADIKDAEQYIKEFRK